MNFLIDTCVVSELSKSNPDKNVLQWFDNCPEDQIFLSSLTLGEIQYGISIFPESRKKNDLSIWFNKLIDAYKDSTLNITDNICLRWGNERAKLEQKGIQLGVVDGLISCTAIEYNYALVTRNMTGVDISNLKVLNPWKS